MVRSTYLMLISGLVPLAVPAAVHGQQKSVDEQIADAVSPLPETDRAGATVLGYRGSELEVVRTGSNSFVCLADRPDNEAFQVACYHKTLEPFMARGRQLRSEGKSASEIRQIRAHEIESGQLDFPARASLMQLMGSINEATGRPDTVRSLHVIYLPFATPEELGLPATPAAGGPWLMDSGQHRAHVMIAGPPRPFRP